MKRILIIDALNAYLRAYIVDPSLSTNGQPIGGIKGFVKILQKLVRETRPDQIAVIGIVIFVDQNDAGNVIAKVWDGKKEKSYFGDYLKVISERKEE